MSQLTKKALAVSLVKLLNQTTLDKITVKDIAQECGVNRNTFYYHFKDIYDLLEYLFITEAQNLIDEHLITESWQTGCLRLANYLLDNKKMIYHVYSSFNREQLERYLYSVTDDILLAFIKMEADELKEQENIQVFDDDIKFITNFHKYALVGLLFEWIRNGMKENPEELINKIAIVTDNHAKSYLRRCSKERNNTNNTFLGK